MKQTIKGTKELVFFFRDYNGLPLDKLIKDLIDVSNGCKQPITVRDSPAFKTSCLTIDTEREETDEEYKRRKHLEAAKEAEDYKVYLQLKERFEK